MPVGKLGIAKGQKIRLGKSYEPSTTARSWSYSSLLQLITGLKRDTIQSIFSRNNKKLHNSEDVASYLNDYYKKDARKNPSKYR